MLNVLDDYNRQVLRIEADTCLPARRVIRVLEQLEESRGLPYDPRGQRPGVHQPAPRHLVQRPQDHARLYPTGFIQTGKSTQNAYVERLNGSLRRELLNAYVFRTLDEVREKAQEWQHDYNHHRPHKSLGQQPPASLIPLESSSFGWAR
jgi:putative transposase